MLELEVKIYRNALDANIDAHHDSPVDRSAGAILSLVRIIAWERELPRDMVVLRRERSLAVERVLRRCLPDFSLSAWTLVALFPHTPNRITRYKRLWKSERGKIPIPGVERRTEVEFEEGSEIGYAGIVQVASGSFLELLDFCDRGERPIILPAHDRIASDEETIVLYKKAYPLDRRGQRQWWSTDWYELASHYCSRGDIVIRTASEFDERLALGNLIMPVDYLAHFEDVDMALAVAQ